MLQFKNLLSRYRTLVVTIIVMMLLMGLAMSLSFHAMGTTSNTLQRLSHWFSTHRLMVLLWHGLLLIAIAYAWDMKINRLKQGRSKKITPQQLRTVRSVGFALLACVVFIDLFLFL